MWLGATFHKERLPSDVCVLDVNVVASVEMTVRGLNQGLFKCSEDPVCIVYCPTDRGYFLLHRQNRKATAELIWRALN